METIVLGVVFGLWFLFSAGGLMQENTKKRNLEKKVQAYEVQLNQCKAQK